MGALTDLDLSSHILGSDPLLRRRALSKAITLTESSRCEDQLRAEALLESILPHTGASFRLGVTGPPGIGKSTFVDALGLLLIAGGARVAVLCVDPVSNLGGGAILADKARMDRLAGQENAYIRPSSGSAAAGGVASHTRAAIRFCEAAGFDFVIVETVGVGQNECAVSTMTDLLALLQGPHAMDEMQILKRGLYEHVDLILVNKTDLSPATALEARSKISSALRIARHSAGQSRGACWTPVVRAISALTGEGFEPVLEDIRCYREGLREHITQQRREQDRLWVMECIGPRKALLCQQNPLLHEALLSLTAQVEADQLVASVAARNLLALGKEHGVWAAD
jgi:LAO/AO transport system kinase